MSIALVLRSPYSMLVNLFSLHTDKKIVWILLHINEKVKEHN